MATAQSLRRNLEHRKGRRDQLQHSIDDLKNRVRMDKRLLTRCERALEIVKQVALTTQKQLEYHLAEQVNLAMEAVFDDPYSLEIDFQEKRGRTEAEILVTRRGLRFRPRGNAGEGVVNIAAFALRVAYWSMRQDRKVRPLLILDEPFPQLKGEDANGRALAIMQELSSQMGIQIITVGDERVPRKTITDTVDKVFLVSQNAQGVSNTKEC